MTVVVVVGTLLIVIGCHGAAVTTATTGVVSIRTCRNHTTTTTDETYGRFGVIASHESHLQMNCSWEILNPNQETLLFSFTRFDLESRHCMWKPRKCCFCHLAMYATNTSTTRKWGRKAANKHRLYTLPHHYRRGSGDVMGAGRVCGSSLPPPITTEAHRIYVNYSTALSVIASHCGFRMVYHIKSNGVPCESDEFTCSNSHLCVPRTNQCDGQVDCPDHSDENTCGVKMEQVEESSCQHQPTYVKCDGVWQCPQGEDEKGCGGCGKDRWWCGVGQECYTTTQRCDGIFHCSNARDELSCSPRCPNQVNCMGEGCYLPYQRCDGSPDCGDATDEEYCTPELCNPQNLTFLCDNRRCIRETWRCDQLDDCRDGSDEQDCLRNSMILVASMGGLMCSLLLVVAVGCTGRLYALRMGLTRLQGSSRTSRGGEQQGSAGRGPPVPRSRLEEHLLQREMPPPYDVAVNDQSSSLFSTWGCHRQWRRPSLPQDRAASPPSTIPRVPVYGGTPTRNPNPLHPSTQGLTVEIQQGERGGGGEKVEDNAEENAFFSTHEDDVPLLSALVGGGCHDRGEEEDDQDVPLLDLISTSSASSTSTFTSTCELESDVDMGPSSLGIEVDEEFLIGTKGNITFAHHGSPTTTHHRSPTTTHHGSPTTTHHGSPITTRQSPTTTHTNISDGVRGDETHCDPPSSSSSSSSSSLPDDGDVLSDTRAAVLALSAVQSHMDSMTHSDTEMISQ